MIQVKDETISSEGNLTELLVEFTAIVGWLRFVKKIDEKTINKLVNFGLDKESFEEMTEEV